MARLNLTCRLRAFSLLELIIAVGILSTGIILILQALAFSGRTAGLSNDIINALLLAQDKIQELEFKQAQRLLKEEAVGDKQDKFIWEYRITTPELNPGLYYLELDIGWQRLQRRQNLSFSTYLGK